MAASETGHQIRNDHRQVPTRTPRARLHHIQESVVRLTRAAQKLVWVSILDSSTCGGSFPFFEAVQKHSSPGRRSRAAKKRAPHSPEAARARVRRCSSTTTEKRSMCHQPQQPSATKTRASTLTRRRVSRPRTRRVDRARSGSRTSRAPRYASSSSSLNGRATHEWRQFAQTTCGNTHPTQ